MEKSGTLNFRTEDQKVLFDHEIRGQLSDGYWENTRPHRHHSVWCRAETRVDPANIGRDFWAPKCNYNLVNKDLLDVVGNRMIAFVKIARLYGAHRVETLKHLIDLDGNFAGLPTYNGSHYDGVRANIAVALAEVDQTLHEVGHSIATDPYNRRDLLRDLREVMVAMRTGS
jgi:hypothetical protein